MTNEHDEEGVRKTVAWVEQHEAEYAYAYFDGSALSRSVGQQAWPHAAVIGPDGTLIYSGHPSGLTEALIEEHLEGAITKPIFEWDDAVSKVADALRAKELGKALKEAQKLVEKGVTDADVALATAQMMVDAAVRSVVNTFEAGNFLDAHTNAERYVDQLKGLEAAEKLQAIIETCETDETAKTVIGAQRKLRSLLTKRLRKKRDADSLIEKLRAMAEEHEGTYVVVEAENAIRELEAVRETLR